MNFNLQFLNLKKMRVNLLADLNFLLKCRDNHVIPKFIILNSNCKLPNFENTLKRFKLSMLRQYIKNKRKDLAFIDVECYKLHLKLAKNTSIMIWNELDIKYNSICTSISESKWKKLNEKFNNLKYDQDILTQEAKNTKQITTGFVKIKLNPPCINKSSKIVSDKEQHTLSLGLNYGLIPETIPVDNLIASVECHISNSKDASIIRREVSNVIKTEIPVKNDNINHNSKEIRNTLTSFKERDLIVSRADKGGTIVILDKHQYVEGLENILKDKAYKQITRKNANPSETLHTLVNKRINNASIFTDMDKYKLKTQCSRLPVMYALPKIHKVNMPFRPIISNIGCATHPLAKHISNKLSFLNKDHIYTVKDSFQFADIIQKTIIKDSDILVSFDVISLFPSVPKDETLKILEERLKDKHYSTIEINDITDLIKTCTDNIPFTCMNKLFKQISGLSMGSPLSPLLADIFMNLLEHNLFKSKQQELPSLWLRFVDDIFAIWSHGRDTIDKFVEYLNNLHPNIKFTVEIESNNSIPFLDVLVTKQENKLITSIYRKPYSVNLPPHAKSSHFWPQKMSAIKGFVNKAIKITSTKEALKEELNYLKNVAMARGFETEIVDKIYTKLNKVRNTTLSSLKTPKGKIISLEYVPNLSSKIGNILEKYNFFVTYKTNQKICNCLPSLKTKTPLLQKSGVYQIPCQCNKIYIGQTARKLEKRRNEHKNTVDLIDKKINLLTEKNKCDIKNSALANHVLICKEKIKWDEIKLLKHCNNSKKLYTLEGIEIYKNISRCINLSTDNILQQEWKDLLDALKDKKEQENIKAPSVSWHNALTTLPSRQ